MLYDIFDARMRKVDWVDAVSDKDALQHAKKKYPGAAVQRVLTRDQQRQKDYEEEAEMWSAINRSYR